MILDVAKDTSSGARYLVAVEVRVVEASGGSAMMTLVADGSVDGP